MPKTSRLPGVKATVSKQQNGSKHSSLLQADFEEQQNGDMITGLLPWTDMECTKRKKMGQTLVHGLCTKATNQRILDMIGAIAMPYLHQNKRKTEYLLQGKNRGKWGVKQIREMCLPVRHFGVSGN